MFLAQFEEIYSYIFFLNLITSSILDCYSIFLLISQSLSLRTSLLFYTTGPFGYSWKLKTEKYCSKIIFKCVNSTVRPIFNEKIAEKWNLWVHEQCIVCIDWLKKCKKSQILQLLFMHCAWTVAASLTNAWKRKEKKRKTQTWFLNVAYISLLISTLHVDVKLLVLIFVPSALSWNFWRQL